MLQVSHILTLFTPRQYQVIACYYYYCCKAMKTLALFFSFAFVLVFTAPTKKLDEKYHLLQRIIIEANKTLNEGPEALLDSLVPADFNEDRCRANGPKDFCIAEMILSGINQTQYRTPDNRTETISRVLKQYNAFHPTNCNMKKNGDEEQLRALLINLYKCAQVIYSRHHPVAHHKTTPAL
uniref:Interleukin-4 n=1 Tax=Hucho hucho TaxID=62062 RepID=A0A4W5QI21_9TELE